jgi:hypothetical protein
MKRASEGKLGEALRGMDLEPLIVYKPPDDARNWKPCDFMVWWGTGAVVEGAIRRGSAWVEAKDTPNAMVFPFAELRPSQIKGIRDAGAVGFPYLLCIWWRPAQRWTISDAVRVLAWFEDIGGEGREPKSIPRELLMSRFGVDADNSRLGMTIKTILEDGW